MAKIQLANKSVNTNGELPSVGMTAPAFELINSRLQTKTLNDFADKPKLISIVPSLDTEVCAHSTQHIDSLEDENCHRIIVSADLPFAQQRFVKQYALKNIQCLSLMRSHAFAEDYGVLLLDGPLAGLCARALLALDKDNRVVYSELVSEITREPNYQSALDALQALV
ncbi:MAG: thiol peroxidase [Gammaproteobacteria bacterium]|nr:thiol peroxidase [Gammaproteobacteria bacterium]MDH5728708.1 thiol peroxidase [Gammaproteobacteria bacterium]